MRRPLFMLVIVVVAFFVAFASVLPVRIQQMSPDPLFVFQVIPIGFWISICVIASVLFFMFPHLNEKRFRVLFVFSSIVLIIGFRLAFPVSFTSVPAYEPDTTSYMNIIGSWARSGIDFGVEGDYQHNYPLAFLTGFAFVKLGVPLDTFFRVAPFVIYAIDIILLYLLLKEVTPEKNKDTVPTVAVFLFSISSVGYWVSVHYCPELFGTMMYFFCLYLTVRFAKSGQWSIKSLLPLFVSLFLLILTHHLSTLYLIISLFGFSLSTWFFKPAQFKRGALSFFILAIFTYTVWFVYGSLVYPTFFNVYVYFSGFTSVTQQTATAGWINNVAFAIYPVFILVLFLMEFLKTVQIGNPLNFVKNLRLKLREIRVAHSDNMLLVFTAGFVLIFLLFAVGFGVPALFGTRILEVVCLALYPFASQSLMKLANSNSPKKRAIVLLIIILVVFTGLYRYYTQIQRRVIIS